MKVFMKKIGVFCAGVAVFTMLAVPAMARELVLGLIPAEGAEEMVKKFEPMRAYLESKTGHKVRMFTATDYTAVIEAMHRKRVDIAWFGPLSYYLAERKAGAEAFAVGIRKGSDCHTYQSIIVVPGDSTARTIHDLRGKNVAFVDPASTSGGLVPTFMVKKATGKMPRYFFGKITYAGSHDAAALAVKNKTVDAAAMSDITYKTMLGKGLITKETNRILLASDPIPGSPLVYRKDLPEDLKAKIREAILGAHKDIQVTGFGELSHYVAVNPADYQVIRDMVRELGLLEEDLLK